MTQHHSFHLPSGGVRGRTFTVLGQTVTERVTPDDSPSGAYVFDEIIPPGLGVPPHCHSLEDECVLVRAGLLEVYLDGQVTQAGPGSLLGLPRGGWHGFRVTGPQPAETTWIVTPGVGTQALLRALGQFPPGPPDWDRLDALNKAHGITMPQPGPTWW